MKCMFCKEELKSAEFPDGLPAGRMGAACCWWDEGTRLKPIIKSIKKIRCPVCKHKNPRACRECVDAQIALGHPIRVRFHADN